MPQPSLQADAIGLPITREQVEAHIDALIDLLDTIDTDSDFEPDLAVNGGVKSGHAPE